VQTKRPSPKVEAALVVNFRLFEKVLDLILIVYARDPILLAGQPSPQVTWWRDHALLDDSVDDVTDDEVTNELRLMEMDRDDLHAVLTCQASNNNISVPASTSVKIDMHCEWRKGSQRVSCFAITVAFSRALYVVS